MRPLMLRIPISKVYGNVVYETAARSGGMYVASLAVDPVAKLLFVVAYKGISGKRFEHVIRKGRE